MKIDLPKVLTFNGGYVDTAGFLALYGLFTAHVTGNFVMIGDALAHGSAGLLGKLLALPMFCLTILVLQVIALRKAAPPRRSLRVMLLVQALVLTLAAVAAIGFGPFASPDQGTLILTGMLLVAGMAVQNAAHKLHLASAPPSTLMTGTTTQIVLDLGSFLHLGPATPAEIKPRLARLSLTVLAFALGCAAAALVYILLDMWCFVLPPLLTLLGLALHDNGAAPKTV